MSIIATLSVATGSRTQLVFICFLVIAYYVNPMPTPLGCLSLPCDPGYSVEQQCGRTGQSGCVACKRGVTFSSLPRNNYRKCFPVTTREELRCDLATHQEMKEPDPRRDNECGCTKDAEWSESAGRCVLISLPTQVANQRQGGTAIFGRHHWDTKKPFSTTNATTFRESFSNVTVLIFFISFAVAVWILCSAVFGGLQKRYFQLSCLTRTEIGSTTVVTKPVDSSLQSTVSSVGTTPLKHDMKIKGLSSTQKTEIDKRSSKNDIPKKDCFM
eukprot:m.124931 g.124931  ORF g.124931 m.124931 type:complete len:271 (+) comp37862_c1_seq6:368-1180(+)